jgi:hypothetical protein
MMSRIDPIRRAALTRRAAKPEAEAVDQAREVYASNLPALVDATRSVPPRDAPPEGAAIFGAQLLGQDGQKRGLRAGPQLIDHAKTSYVRTEFSGSFDRRARKGKILKTEI